MRSQENKKLKKRCSVRLVPPLAVIFSQAISKGILCNLFSLKTLSFFLCKTWKSIAKCSFLPYLNACILWLCAQPCMRTGLFVFLTEWKALKRSLKLRLCIDFVIKLQHKKGTQCLQFLKRILLKFVAISISNSNWFCLLKLGNTRLHFARLQNSMLLQ